MSTGNTLYTGIYEFQNMEVGSNLLLFLISVILISFSGVAMPGPVFAVTVAKGHKDKNAGALIAFGHGIIEFPLMLLIYLGFSKFFTSSAVKTVIGFLGGGMLVFMGVQMFRARKGQGFEGRELSLGPIYSGILTTGANPYFFLWWGTIGAALIVTASTFGFFGFMLFSAIHLLCDFFWGLFVSTATFKTKHRWGRKTHELVFGLCSAILIIFGGWFLLSSVNI